MKIHFKRACLIMMSLVLLVSASACGTNSAASEASSKSDASDTTSKTETQTVSQAFLDSLKGMTISIAYPDKMRNPGKSPQDDEWQILLNKVGKELGVTIKEDYYTNKENGGSFIADSLSGKNLGNVEVIWYDMALTGVQRNAWAKLDDAAKDAGVNFSNSWYFTPTMQATNINGGQYALSYKTQFVDYSLICYNVNMVTVDNKLEDPLDLYNKGQWTFDKFEEYCKKLTKKDAGGNITTYGCQFPATAWISELVKANGGAIGRITASGSWQQTLADSKTINALNYIYKWFYKDKCMYVPTGTWGTSFKNLYDGTTAMAVGSGACALDSYLQLKDAGGLGVVPLPTGPDATKDDALKYNGGFTYVIPAAYQADAAKYLYVMDLVSKRWYENYENVYKAQATTIFKQDKYYDLFYKYQNDSLATGIDESGLSHVADSSGYSSSMLIVDITNGVSPATAVDRFSSAMQSAANDAIGNTKYTGFSK